MTEGGSRWRARCRPERPASQPTHTTPNPQTGPVAPGPAPLPTPVPGAPPPAPTDPPVVRVLTYNLLADQYAASDYAKAHLFAHCHPT